MVNQKKINEWTAALRSGKYNQATGVLAAQEKNTYCCLGLLCVLSGGEVRDNPGHNTIDKAIHMYGANYTGLPPFEMVEVLGLDHRAAFDTNQDDEENDSRLKVWDMYPDWGDVKDVYGTRLEAETSIAAMNDQGFTFEQIADVIDYFGVR